jgi:hypothetical protein
MAKEQKEYGHAEVQPNSAKMTMGTYIDKNHISMSMGKKSIFLAKYGKFIKSESEWETIVRVELSRKIQ